MPTATKCSHVRKNTPDFIRSAQSLHGKKFDYSKSEYVNARTPITIKCRACGTTFKQVPNNHLRGAGCDVCGKAASAAKRCKSHKDFVREAVFVHGSKFDYSKSVYIKSTLKVKITCKTCKHSFEQTPKNHVQHMQGCPACAKNRKLTTSRFIKNAKSVHAAAYSYAHVKYVNAQHKVRIVCNTCGLEFQQLPTAHTKGAGCPKCGGTQKQTQKQFLARAKEVHGNAYDYSKVEYKAQRYFIDLKCNKCGSLFKQRAYNHLNGHGCANCFSSKGELLVEDALKKLKLKHTRQYMFDACTGIRRKLPFDFAVLDNRARVRFVIEYQGEQHYKPVRFNGISSAAAHQNLKAVQKTDKLKNKYCVGHGIPLLCLSYKENFCILNNIRKFAMFHP